jgi:hypothetical protein
MTQQQHHLQSTFGNELCDVYHTQKEGSTKPQKNLRHGLSKSLILKTLSRLEIEGEMEGTVQWCTSGCHLSKLYQMHVSITPQSKSNNLLDSQEFGCILCS